MRHFLIAALAAFVLAAAPVSGARAGTACDQSDTDCINTLVSDIEAQIGVGPVPWERILMALGAREATNAVMTLRQMRTWVRIYQGSNVVNGAVHLPIMERVLATLEAWDGAPPPQVVQNPPPNDPPEVPENNNDPQQPVVVENNDPQPTVVENSDPQPELPANAVTVEEVEAWRDNPKFAGNAEHIARWNRVLAALGVDNGAQPMTAADAQEFADKGWAPWVRTAPTLAALEALEAWRQGQGQNQQSSPAEVPARTATLGPGGTIPVQVVPTGSTTLTVANNGTLTMTDDRSSISKSVCVNPSAGCAAPTERFPDGTKGVNSSLGSRNETFVQKVRPYREVRGSGLIPFVVPASYTGFKEYEYRGPTGLVWEFWDADGDGTVEYNDVDGDGKPSHGDTTAEQGFRENPGSNNPTPVDVGGRRQVMIPKSYINIHTQQGYLDGWTISRFGKNSYDDAGGHWGAYNAPVYGYRKNVSAWTYTPGSNGEKRRIPWGNAQGYRDISTWGVVGYTTKYRHMDDVPRWFVAAKHDGGESYRAFGYWALADYLVPRNRIGDWHSSVVGLSVSVFAGGTDPATDVSGVSGSASYRGEAAGGIRWREERVIRFTTFEGARTDLTANFDRMRIDAKVYLQGENNFNTHVRDSLQPADGHDNPNLSLDHLRTILHNDLDLGAAINNDGSFTGSDMTGQFYQPDGSNAPGSVLGTFVVQNGSASVTNPTYYKVEGAFGAEKR